MQEFVLKWDELSSRLLRARIVRVNLTQNRILEEMKLHSSILIVLHVVPIINARKGLSRVVHSVTVVIRVNDA